MRANLPPVRRPVLIAGAFFAAGSLCGQLSAAFAAPLAAAGAAAAVAALWIALRLRGAGASPASSLAACMLAFALAWTSSAISRDAQETQARELRALMQSAQGRDIELAGFAASESVARQMGSGSAQLAFDFQIDSIAGAETNVIAGAAIKVIWWGPASLAGAHPPFPLPRAGEGWRFTGRLKELAPRGIGAPVFVFTVGRARSAGRRDKALDQPLPAAGLWMARKTAARILSAGLEDRPQAIAVAKAMTLGLRSDLPDEVADFFRNSGTAHVFSISGLHVMLVARIIMTLLSALSLGIRARSLAFAPAIIAYTVMTGGASSAVRACLMALLYYGAPLFGRRPDPISALAGAASLILAIAPSQIADPGFALSFICTGGILLMTPRFAALFEPLNAKLCPAPRRASEPRWLLALKWLEASFSVSLAAWLASVPVTAAIFGQLTPIALLANLAIVPMSSLIVASAASSLGFSIISPWISEVFNAANAFLCDTMVRIASWCANLPGANFEVSSWGVWQSAIWFAALSMLCHRLASMEKKAQASAPEDIFQP